MPAPLWQPLRHTLRNRCLLSHPQQPCYPLHPSPTLLQTQPQHPRCFSRKTQEQRFGTTTPVPDTDNTSATPANLPSPSQSPFYFEAGYALYAKRPSRPFPPPFLSYPSHSFTEPLSTWNKSRDRRPGAGGGGLSYVNGEMIRGITNGDDAVLVSDSFVGVNDGVGAWAAKERGHAALWSRLILHFWFLEHFNATQSSSSSSPSTPDPISYLQRAFDLTKEATSTPNEWFGTTTASAAILSSTPSSPNSSTPPHPLLYITQLGDSQILVLRPRDKSVIFKTTEQWHWFDCPRQLGTNSPDTPTENAVMDLVEIEEDDVVLAMSDGVVDNLWEHEVVQNVVDSMDKWKNGGASAESAAESGKEPGEQTYADGMRFVAQELVNAARTIAEDPFAESPYMEKAVDEGLSIEGGMFLWKWYSKLNRLIENKASLTISAWSLRNAKDARVDRMTRQNEMSSST
ncbi:phosphatase 2C-like domain-containing protein [Clohesyomyces aquaticus]|uniref:Protein phosphatase n=1 Tax=Clohesyomyces aquaticus TaxID=1231657 RepID=A0A1Y1ZXT2_9PLEO|nr:phosphatase 2C-like domain-containing protein [Clohesyomyces aquaticus]